MVQRRVLQCGLCRNNEKCLEPGRCWLNRQAKFYYENVVRRYALISFYLSNAIVYCTYHVFSSFLLCCNASAFVICAIKNYLLTYLL